MQVAESRFRISLQLDLSAAGAGAVEPLQICSLAGRPQLGMDGNMA